MQIDERIGQLFREEPRAAAVLYEGQARTWADLQSIRDGLQAVLEPLGIGSGEGVGLVLRPRPDCFGAYIGLLSTRRCAVLVTPIQPDAAICDDVRGLRLKALVANREDWSRPGLIETARAVGCVGIELTGDLDDPVRPVDGLERLGPGPRYEPHPDAAVTILTSGTTGPPKRVPVSYAQFAGSPPERPRPPAQRGVSITAVPLVSLGGVLGTTATIWRGRPTALMDRFDVWKWAELVRDHRPRQLAAPPAVLRMLLDSKVPKEYLSSATVYRAASAPLDPATADEFEATYGIPVVTAYGATEFLGAVTGFVPDDFGRTREKRCSVGRAFPGNRVRIVDSDTGEELPRGTTGLLEADPPSRPADAPPGWIRSNDLARMDEDGFVWIEGRVDDVLIRGGFKVPTEEVAALLRTHPAVADAAVVGLPDPRLHQVPAAAVVLRPEETVPSSKALMDWVRDRKPGYCVPVKIAFLDAIPRNAMFKVMSPALRELIDAAP